MPCDIHRSKVGKLYRIQAMVPSHLLYILQACLKNLGVCWDMSFGALHKSVGNFFSLLKSRVHQLGLNLCQCSVNFSRQFWQATAQNILADNFSRCNALLRRRRQKNYSVDFLTFLPLLIKSDFLVSCCQEGEMKLSTNTPNMPPQAKPMQTQEQSSGLNPATSRPCNYQRYSLHPSSPNRIILLRAKSTDR